MGTKQQITERIGSILRESKLSVTETRTRILELFMKSNGALEHSDF